MRQDGHMSLLLLMVSPVRRPQHGTRCGVGHRHTPAIVTKLDRYLQAPCNPMVADMIEWWLARRTEYPVLSKMALDYWSSLGVSVNCIFDISLNHPAQLQPQMLSGALGGCILLSHICNSLSATSVHVSMCLQSWYEAGLITNDLFLDLFN